MDHQEVSRESCTQKVSQENISNRIKPTIECPFDRVHAEEGIWFPLQRGGVDVQSSEVLEKIFGGVG